MNLLINRLKLSVCASVLFCSLQSGAQESGEDGDRWDFVDQQGSSDCGQDPRMAYSLHAGRTTPRGDLAKSVDQGTTVNLDLVFPINSRLGWDIRLGYSDFSGLGAMADVETTNLSANLSYILIDKTPWVFANIGPGLYYINQKEVEFGANIGVGVGYPWGPNRVLEFTYNYHWAISASPQHRFDKIQIGIVQRF